MTSLPRHRVVYSEDLQLLKVQVASLREEGWRTIGEPAKARATASDARPYWVQALYKHDQSIPLESYRVDDPDNASSPPR